MLSIVLSLLLSIRGRSDVTGWTRAKRLGAVFVDGLVKRGSPVTARNTMKRRDFCLDAGGVGGRCRSPTTNRFVDSSSNGRKTAAGVNRLMCSRSRLLPSTTPRLALGLPECHLRDRAHRSRDPSRRRAASVRPTAFARGLRSPAVQRLGGDAASSVSRRKASASSRSTISARLRVLVHSTGESSRRRCSGQRGRRQRRSRGYAILWVRRA